MSRFYLKKKVAKSNRLIHAREEKPLTVLEQKLFLLCAAALRHGTEDKDGYITIPFSEIYETPNSNNYRDIRKACKSLITSAISIEEDDDDGNFVQGDYKSIFAHIKAHARKGSFEFQFNNHITKEIKGITGNFTQYVIDNAFNFTKTHSLKIYELLIEGAYKYRQREFSRIALLQELGLENAKTYKTFTKIKDKILDPVCNDICDHSDIEARWEISGKRGRGITHITFFWEYKTKKEKVEVEENTGDNSTSNDDSQIEKMRAIGLTDAQIEAALGVKIQTTIDITPQQKVEVQKKDSSTITETNTIPNKQQYQGVSADILNKIKRAETRMNELGIDRQTIKVAIEKYTSDPNLKIWPEINDLKMAIRDGQSFPNVHTFKKWVNELD